ncbi:MAG TPA: MATE family efflux transporter [Candidatus Flavonifractor merdigallinarum]|uniref:Probable multidrug resistance protein NorM n=1 Tax=Candidatus Flavonifractor merdigallinarum TaxID=2838589 RepID=A0A9D1YAV2_9FIRM|nr:MATE family efflux transporter [Candidatus Flavonifractor merdigallinarum]
MTRDLTTGSPMRLILQFAVPTLLGLLFQQFYNLVDTMIVGKLLGAQALAAVGSTGSINFFVIGFCTGVCSGFAIPVAQRMGAGMLSQMRRYVANAAYLSALFALVLTTATGLGCRGILTLMRTPSDIFAGANAYIFVIFMGIPVTFLYNLLAGILRSLGDSRTPVYFLAMSSFLNIFLDFALILWFHAGVAGAAIATVVSQGISGLACLAYMVKKFPILRMTREERRLDRASCKVLCAMGIPMGLQYSITAIGSIILQSAVNVLGSTYVAAVAAGVKLFQLLGCPFDAMGATMATYCGQNVGACRLDRLGQGIRACSLLGLVYSAIAFCAMLVFAAPCAMLFLNPAEPQLDLLVDLTSRYVVTLTAFFFPLALVNIVRFSIQGMGFSVFAILAGVLEMLARTGVGIGLVPVFGYAAVCFASPAAWIAADLFLVPASMACIRKLRQIYPNQPESPLPAQAEAASPKPLRTGAGT